MSLESAHVKEELEWESESESETAAFADSDTEQEIKIEIDLGAEEILPQDVVYSMQVDMNINLESENLLYSNGFPDVPVEEDVQKIDEGTIPRQHKQIGVNNHRIDKTIDEWTKFTDDLSDNEFDAEEPCPVFTPIRNSGIEPALDSDLTAFQLEVLTTEDRQNDSAIKDIAQGISSDFNWTKNKEKFLGQRETYTGIQGPTFPITDETIVDVFYKMIDSDFIDLLCTETNRYASQRLELLTCQNKLSPNSQLLRWTPTNRDEIITFLALQILEGLYPLPEEESYFTFNGFGTMPHFRKIMSHKRCMLLRSLLHFVDNESLNESALIEPTRLSKIQPVIDYFNDKFCSLYYPGQDVVIDESLLINGRLGFAQKIHSKAQAGIKTYELCEASSGYLWQFFLLEGTPDFDETRPDSLETSDTFQSARIVYDLIEPILHRGHTVTMDSFYNSPLLARCLKGNKTDCYGPLRLHREFIPENLNNLEKTDFQPGEVVTSYCSDLSVMVWRDASLVSMISTYHNLEKGSSNTPDIVLQYNKTKKGVGNQFLSSQLLYRQRVWYKRLFNRIFNAALFNCYVIFKTGNPTITQRDFRTVLANDLIKLHRRIDISTERRVFSARPRSKVEKHFPVRTGFKRSRCRLCAEGNRLTRTVWKCLHCDVNLCIENCFLNFHVNK